MKKYILIFALILPFIGQSQQEKISIEKATLGYMHGLYPQTKYYLQWIENSSSYIYYDTENQDFPIVDAKSKKTIHRISLEKLRREIQGLYVPDIKRIDTENIVFQHQNVFYTFNYKTQKIIQKIPLKEKAENPHYNHQKQAVAYTIENNLYLATPENNAIAITSQEDKNIVSGQSIHRNEFGIKNGIFWSEKGNFIAFYQKDETNVTQYPLVDNSTTPASLNHIKYPMAGQKSEQAKIGIFNLKTQKTSYLDIDTSDEHYLTNLSWTPDEKFILLAEINREQNHYDLNLYDVQTGKKVRTIFSESNSKWVEPEHSAYFLPKKNDEFLWISEKDGFANVYLYNLNGKGKQLTKFKQVVKNILGFTANGKEFFVSATGQDPRELRTYKISVKNGKFTDLTPIAGTHKTQINSDGSYLIDQYSSISVPNKIDIVSVANNQRTNILTAENPLENYNVGQVEFVNLTADDQKTILYGKIVKPKNFNPKKKYPVLVYVYGGPHAQLVTNSWMAGTDLWMMALSANEDYIIFTLDNRGTENRGFEFESIIHRNLETYAVKDQLKGVEYLKSLPYVDANRLAVYGWSFGGYMASSLMLRHPDTFRVAIAGGAVIDWKYYEVMYGERYMDTPQENPLGYENSCVLPYVKNLNGKLLYIHGYIDDVVLPQHLLAVGQKAVEEGKHIDMFLYTTHKHNVGGKQRAHLTQYITQYLLKHNNE